MSQQTKATREHARLEEIRSKQVPWRKWGPYLSERQWGGVRENVNQGRRGLERRHARSVPLARLPERRGRHRRILRREDAALLRRSALWNGKDPILKERMFGLTNSEGNHGEDVKEYYFYLDSTPTHSYAKMLYKYPQAAFPYGDLVAENRRRSQDRVRVRADGHRHLRRGPLLGRVRRVREGRRRGHLTSASPRSTAGRRRPRCTSSPSSGSATPGGRMRRRRAPSSTRDHHDRCAVIAAKHPAARQRFLYCDGPVELLFTDNETNRYRLWGQPNPTQFQKDGINDYIVQGRQNAVNPARKGTKSAAHHARHRAGPARAPRSACASPTAPPGELADPFGHVRPDLRRPQARGRRVLRRDHPAFAERRRRERHPPGLRRAALDQAGLRLRRGAVAERARRPARLERRRRRNQHWFHMYSADIISMPDKWEYPWFAAWDLAFHAVSLAFVDPDFAARAARRSCCSNATSTRTASSRPTSGTSTTSTRPSTPGRRSSTTASTAEAWATRRSRSSSAPSTCCWPTSPGGSTARTATDATCSRAASSGLDNIGVFDRSSPLPTGGYLEQADGTAWMAFYAQNMLDIALELALVDPTYEDMAIKFYEHVISIAAAIEPNRARTIRCGTRRTASSTTCSACPDSSPRGSR